MSVLDASTRTRPFFETFARDEERLRLTRSCWIHLSFGKRMKEEAAGISSCSSRRVVPLGSRIGGRNREIEDSQNPVDRSKNL